MSGRKQLHVESDSSDMEDEFDGNAYDLEEIHLDKEPIVLTKRNQENKVTRHHHEIPRSKLKPKITADPLPLEFFL